MGRRTLDLAVSLDPSFALGEVPADGPLGGIRGWNRSGKAAQHRLVQFRPELQQGQGAIQAHIEALVPGVIETFENAEAAHRVVGTGGAPEGAAAAEVVELVEQRHPQRLTQALALEHRPLPGLDPIAPLAPVAQGFGGDGGGMAPLHAEEVGVTPHRLAAAGKRRHRQIPTDRHRDRQRLARLELALHGQGRAEVILTATAPVVIAVGDGAIGREAAPEFAAIPGWIPAAAALDADAGLILCGDAPLTLTLGNRRGAVAFEKDAAECSLIDAAIALPLGPGDGRDIVVLRLPSSRKCTSAEASVLVNQPVVLRQLNSSDRSRGWSVGLCRVQTNTATG